MFVIILWEVKVFNGDGNWLCGVGVVDVIF